MIIVSKYKNVCFYENQITIEILNTLLARGVGVDDDALLLSAMVCEINY